MATLKVILDKRNVEHGKPAPLKLQIVNFRKTTLVPLDIRLTPDQWDVANCRVVNHKNKATFNTYIMQRRLEVEAILLGLGSRGKLNNITSGELRKMIDAELFPSDPKTSLVERFNISIERRISIPTKRLYENSLKHISDYAPDLESLKMEDITFSWLHNFNNYLQDKGLSANSRAMIFTNFRAVFNDAINDEVITNYPFRKFKFKSETVKHAVLDIDELRLLFASPATQYEKRCMDIFKLVFCLIGINIVDLCAITEITQGRIEYRRAKTHRLYSIKVEPEAMALIEQLRDNTHLIGGVSKLKSYMTVSATINRSLTKIAKRAELPHISVYTARRSWATIAHSIGIPKDTISLALGHSFGLRVTDFYVNYDMSKVDEANRKVLDAVFGHQ